ncbi:hypothetical protein Tco_1269240, partial [Tanacetum coccineum]
LSTKIHSIMSSDPNYEWEQLLDIDDSDLPQPMFSVPATATIIHGPAGIVQSAKLLKQRDIVLGDIKNFLKNGKLKQVVAIIKSCTPNAFGDLTVIVKDLSGKISGAIHHKVINEEGYGKDIIVGSALILANVLVFSPGPSMCYLNITMKNVVKVFLKDLVPGNGSGVGGSGMLMEQEEIAKLIEEEEMTDFEVASCTESGGALGALGANKAITHLVIHIFLYPLRAVEAACALEVDAMGALDLVEADAMGALDLVEVEIVGALDLVEVEAVGALDLPFLPSILPPFLFLPHLSSIRPPLFPLPPLSSILSSLPLLHLFPALPPLPSLPF